MQASSEAIATNVRMSCEQALQVLADHRSANQIVISNQMSARLWPNFKEVEQDYYRRTQIFPIMHTVVVRADVHREHPWVAKSIYKAFSEAKAIALNGLYDTDALRLALPWLIDHVEEARREFGEDFWAYGLEPNRPAFEAIGRYVHEQGLSPRAVSADELFAPGVE